MPKNREEIDNEYEYEEDEVDESSSNDEIEINDKPKSNVKHDLIRSHQNQKPHTFIRRNDKQIFRKPLKPEN